MREVNLLGHALVPFYDCASEQNFILVLCGKNGSGQLESRSCYDMQQSEVVQEELLNASHRVRL